MIYLGRKERRLIKESRISALHNNQTSPLNTLNADEYNISQSREGKIKYSDS